MTESLRRVIDNPFLRENPFKANQVFYSAPKKYQSDSQYKPSYDSTYNDLSVSPATQKYSISTLKVTINEDKLLKKKGNPFFRKNLMTANKELAEDDLQFQPIKIDFSDQSRLKKPQFLNQSKSSNFNGVSNSMYKDLSYKSPSSGSHKYLILQPKIIENLTIKAHNRESSILGGLGSKGYLLSPRFPSVKVIDKQNSHRAVIPELSGLNSLKNVGDQESYCPNYLGFPTLGGNSRLASSKNLNIKFSRQSQPQKNANHHQCSKKANLIIPEDGNPDQITIKGQKFYRSAVQLVKR